MLFSSAAINRKSNIDMQHWQTDLFLNLKECYYGNVVNVLFYRFYSISFHVQLFMHQFHIQEKIMTYQRIVISYMLHPLNTQVLKNNLSNPRPSTVLSQSRGIEGEKIPSIPLDSHRVRSHSLKHIGCFLNSID